MDGPYIDQLAHIVDVFDVDIDDENRMLRGYWIDAATHVCFNSFNPVATVVSQAFMTRRGNFFLVKERDEVHRLADGSYFPTHAIYRDRTGEGLCKPDEVGK